MEILSDSLSNTLKIAHDFANSLSGGEIIELIGQMGAGKTAFTKGLGIGLGVKSQITSPSFSILNIYNGEKFTLCHYDFYRFNDENEFFDCGLDEYLAQKDTICVIEWPQKATLSNYKTIKILIDYVDENTRKITINRGQI